jgi:hypothetical protein
MVEVPTWSAEAKVSRLSRLTRFLAQSLPIVPLLAGCATRAIQDYPRYWPALADTERQCAIDGEYLNAGTMVPASLGVSTDGSGLLLNAHLRPRALGPIGPLSADRVKIKVTASLLVVTVPGESEATSLPMRGDRSACVAAGGYQIEFSQPYAGESGAGILHITRSLALAEDGSLVMKSTHFFDASRSLTRLHKHTEVFWQRFARVEATSSDTPSSAHAPAR